MILYKAVKNYVAHYIPKEKVIEYHANGYIVIKEVDNEDVIKAKPSEIIPEEFFTEERGVDK